MPAKNRSLLDATKPKHSSAPVGSQNKAAMRNATCAVHVLALWDTCTDIPTVVGIYMLPKMRTHGQHMMHCSKSHLTCPNPPIQDASRPLPRSS
eukprot:12031348-Alexandrium_andersonii.AAC.1